MEHLPWLILNPFQTDAPISLLSSILEKFTYEKKNLNKNLYSFYNFTIIATFELGINL